MCLHIEDVEPWRGPYTFYDLPPTHSIETSAVRLWGSIALAPSNHLPTILSYICRPSSTPTAAHLTSTRSPPWLPWPPWPPGPPWPPWILSDTQPLLGINSGTCSWFFPGPGGKQGVLRVINNEKTKIYNVSRNLVSEFKFGYFSEFKTKTN